MREVREREFTGESESESESERYFPFKGLWGPDDQIMEIETPRPESLGQWPEYPGVTLMRLGECKAGGYIPLGRFAWS